MAKVPAADPPANNAAVDEDGEIVLVLFTERVRKVNGVEQQFRSGRIVRLPLSEANWSEWLTGSNQVQLDQKRLKAALEQRLKALQTEIGCTETQLEKLRHAGELDIARFWHDVTLLQRDMGDCRGTVPELKGLIERGEVLRKRYLSGLHDGDSLYHKTLRAMLPHAQLASVEVSFKVQQVRPREFGRDGVLIYKLRNGRLEGLP